MGVRGAGRAGEGERRREATGPANTTTMIMVDMIIVLVATL